MSTSGVTVWLSSETSAGCWVVTMGHAPFPDRRS